MQQRVEPNAEDDQVQDHLHGDHQSRTLAGCADIADPTVEKIVTVKESVSVLVRPSWLKFPGSCTDDRQYVPANNKRNIGMLTAGASIARTPGCVAWSMRRPDSRGYRHRAQPHERRA
jgi:hypothetical protein